MRDQNVDIVMEIEETLCKGLGIEKDQRTIVTALDIFNVVYPKLSDRLWDEYNQDNG